MTSGDAVVVFHTGNNYMPGGAAIYICPAGKPLVDFSCLFSRVAIEDDNKDNLVMMITGISRMATLNIVYSRNPNRRVAHFWWLRADLLNSHSVGLQARASKAMVKVFS